MAKQLYQLTREVVIYVVAEDDTEAVSIPKDSDWHDELRDTEIEPLVPSCPWGWAVNLIPLGDSEGKTVKQWAEETRRIEQEKREFAAHPKLDLISA